MQATKPQMQRRLSRVVGFSLLASIVIGILASVFLTQGIDINLSADVEATARNMLDAEQRVRAKAYLGGLGFALSALFVLGLYHLLRPHSLILAGLGFLLGIASAILVLMGAVYSLNVAELASAPAYDVITSDPQRLMLIATQVSADYTSFHLSLILSSAANACFFYVLLRSGLLPALISGWGLFASLFVASMIVARDFIPALGSGAITITFMLCNLIALVALGLYLVIKGVRTVAAA